MNMKRIILRILSYVLVALLASAITFGVFVNTGVGKLWALERLLNSHFIGETDPQAMKDAAAAAMVDSLGDRWSHYQTAEEFEAYKDTMSNSFVGVGITIQAREDNQGLDIVEVTQGGPAKEAGILPGDVLIKVDGTAITGMDVSDVSALVKGEENSYVNLTLLRGEQELTFKVQRRRIQVVVAAGQMLEDGIGLITIANFDERCAQETIAAIEQLRQQGATALIFDVRNNPGGYKDEMVQVLDYLLPEGPLFRTVDYRGKEALDTSDAKCLDIPMAVVVNLHSYSAAEFFAAALREYDAAVLTGEKTFGKGYFQNTYEMTDGSAVTLSVGKYFTPKGVSLAGVGLTPDVEVAVDEETSIAILSGTLSPQEDPQIQAAVNALKEGKLP